MIELLGIGIIAFVLLVAQQFIYERLWEKNLHVRLLFESDHIFEGEQGTLREVIENKKRLPLAMLMVKFRTSRHLIFGSSSGSRTTDQYYRNDAFRVAGREQVTRTLKFKGGRRGYYRIDEVSLVSSDLFYLNQSYAELPVKTELYVYPRPYDIRRLRMALIRINGELLSRRHLLEDPFEYRGIREYQPYDDIRSINWKATAKVGEYMVNQCAHSVLRRVRIFFNIQDDRILKKEEAVEMSLRVVAALCTYFLKQGVPVSCFGNGIDLQSHKVMALDMKAGERQLEEVYRTLARIDTEQPAADFGETFGNALFHECDDTFTCFVAPNQYDDFVELLTRYQETARPFLWFYPVEEDIIPSLPPLIAPYTEVVYPDYL